MNAIRQKYDSNIEAAKDDTTPAIPGHACKCSDAGAEGKKKKDTDTTRPSLVVSVSVALA